LIEGSFDPLLILHCTAKLCYCAQYH